jgi:hypothetical protein
MSVDLRTCKKGDILISKHGLRLTYLHPEPEGSYYDHRVAYPENFEGITRGEGTRTHDGFVFRNTRRTEDHDIVEIIHIEDENSN